MVKLNILHLSMLHNSSFRVIEFSSLISTKTNAQRLVEPAFVGRQVFFSTDKEKSRAEVLGSGVSRPLCIYN